jgi:hypothetical protein
MRSLPNATKTPHEPSRIGPVPPRERSAPVPVQYRLYDYQGPRSAFSLTVAGDQASLDRLTPGEPLVHRSVDAASSTNLPVGRAEKVLCPASPCGTWICGSRVCVVPTEGNAPLEPMPPVLRSNCLKPVQPFFRRPCFDGGGGAFVFFCPNPLSFASFDRVAAYSAATIGYDGGRPHLVRYSSGVI